MESEETNDVIRQLAYNWFKVELQAGDMTYTHYMDAVIRLQAVTNDVDRTKAIFAAVISQASQLGKPSEWVEWEVSFEAHAIGERPRWLLVDLAAQGGSDDSLDLHNERLNRFC